MKKNEYIVTSAKGTKVRGKFKDPKKAAKAKKASTDVVTCVVYQKD